jgi:ATP-binding cassette subfamily B protein
LAGSFVIEFLLLLSSLGFLFVYNVDSGLITLAIIPVYVGFIFIARPYITSAQNQVMVGFAESQSNYVDTLSGIEVIKNHGLSDIFNHQNLTIYERFQDKVLKMSKLSLKINLVTGFLGTFYLVIIILNASSRVMNDNFSIGQLVAVFTVASGIIPLTAHLTFMMVSFKEAEIAFNRMFELVHYKGTRKNGLKTIDSFQHLTLERISFRYPGRSLLLHDFSLQVRKGKITALIGESGCGKSTLTGILQGFYSIEEGQIKINNLPLDEVASSHWHKKLGIVPQNIHIFNETLFFNITHMKPSKELLELFDKFLLKYGLNTYFNQFPDHVFTLVGENGLSLSGGQQQMVAFLRALYHEPELLILDEFTSAMDTISERLVYKILNQIKPDMGILLITHRLHSIRYLADEICVIEKGSVQNKGTHDELMQGRNFYSHYWNTMLNPDYASINQH